MDFLILLAFSLSVLTYYIGVLIYTLPIPWWGLKKWAPTLIYDSIASMVLLFSYSIIINLANYLAGLFNASWDVLINWILARISILSTISLAISSIIMLGSKVILPPILTSLAGPMFSTIFYIMLALQIILMLSLVLKQYFTKLLLLGIVLYSIPFRLARSVGSGLLAFVIIFNIGLPLLPNFVNFIASDNTALSNLENLSSLSTKEKLKEYGVIFAYGDIVDAQGKPIPKALLKAIINGETLAAYATNDNGRFIAGRPDRGLPKVKTRIIVEYVGFTLKTKPSEIDESDYTYNPFGEATAEYYIKIMVTNIHIIDKFSFIIVDNDINVKALTLNEDNINIRVESKSNTTLKVILNIRYNVTSITVNNKTLDNITYRENCWFNSLIARIYYIPIPQGDVKVNLSFHIENVPLHIKIKELKYIERMLKGYTSLSTLSITNVLGRIFFSWVILPTMYLIMLSSISYSLAYVIGGMRPRLPIKERW